jgi:hypothetical protein
MRSEGTRSSGSTVRASQTASGASSNGPDHLHPAAKQALRLVRQQVTDTLWTRLRRMIDVNAADPPTNAAAPVLGTEHAAARMVENKNPRCSSQPFKQALGFRIIDFLDFLIVVEIFHCATMTD